MLRCARLVCVAAVTGYLGVERVAAGSTPTSPAGQVERLRRRAPASKSACDCATGRRLQLGPDFFSPILATETTTRTNSSTSPSTTTTSTTSTNASLQAVPEVFTEEEKKSTLPLYISLPLIVFLMCCSALFSGLTLGLMSLDLIALEAIVNGDNFHLAECARRIIPVRARGNRLLCTLLLGNVAVNSGLSIITADIDFLGGIIGFLVSTFLIVVFGEIMPQACCAKYALEVGSRTAGLVKVLMIVMLPITYPLALFLDTCLGQDAGQVYSTSELHEMVKLQIEKGAADAAAGRAAKQVVEGALNFRTKKVSDVMTPLEDAYMLWTERNLDFETVREIFEHGFSRIPVYGVDKHEYKGLLYTKDLILADPEDEMRVGDFIEIFDRKALSLTLDTPLVDALDAFKRDHAHLALVRTMNITNTKNPRCELVGVITLEDVVEEILQAEIIDEVDVYEDVDNQVKVGDGRELRKLNLGVFNPVWKRTTGNALEDDEVAAISAHLMRHIFRDGSPFAISREAVEWLVSNSMVANKQRVTAEGTSHPLPKDILYKQGEASSFCTLILQGRATVTVGRDGFKSEAGAFKVLGKEALRDAAYKADFSACISTPKCRYLCMGRENFQKAKLMNLDAHALRDAMSETRARRNSLAKKNCNFPHPHPHSASDTGCNDAFDSVAGQVLSV